MWRTAGIGIPLTPSPEAHEESYMSRQVRALSSIVLLAVFAAIVACNTVEGAGKDVENAGEAVQDAAD